MSRVINLLKNTAVAVRKSPVEIFLSLTVFVLVQFFDERQYVHWFLYFPLYFAFAYSANQIFASKTKFRFVYYLSALLPAVLVLCGIYLYPMSLRAVSPIFISAISALLLMFVSAGAKDNEGFVRLAVRIVKLLFVSGVYAGIWMAIVAACLGTIDVLFSVDAVGLIDIALQFGVLVLFPILFLAVDEDASRDINPRYIIILVDYILTPVFLIYSLILYVYFAKVIFLWKLPQGIIATSSICFLFFAIVIPALGSQLEQPRFKSFFGIIPYLSIPAVVLLWVSCVYRINEYGFTGDRLYLLLAAIILTLWTVCAKFRVGWNTLSVVTAVTLLGFTFVPGLSYYDFEERKVDRDAVANVADPESYFISNNKAIKQDVTAYSTVYSGNAFQSDIVNDSLVVNDADGRLLVKIANEDLISYLLEESQTKEVGPHLVNYYKTEEFLIIFDLLHLRLYPETGLTEVDNFQVGSLFMAF